MNTQYPFSRDVCPSFLAKAEALKPVLRRTEVRPVCVVEAYEDPAAFQRCAVRDAGISVADALAKDYGSGDSFTLDFGDHQVGFLTFRYTDFDRVPDSPLRLRLTFAELPLELLRTQESVGGTLCSNWFQEEIVNIDFIPGETSLPRRYAFRYLKVEVLGQHQGYRVKFTDFVCTAVSSADPANVPPLPAGTPDDLLAIDRVALRTLHDCMQDVFEDGPKRDRRLWLGDLRLQALANHATFRNTALVRRCLYLFAGEPRPDGWASCAIFTWPRVRADGWHLVDYSLFFLSVLHDEWRQNGDLAFTRELWPFAFHQIELMAARMDAKGGKVDTEKSFFFVDWCPGLDKQAAAQGIVVYVFRQALTLAQALGDEAAAAFIAPRIEAYAEVARDFYDDGIGLFRSGPEGQVTQASQAWLVLARVFDDERNRAILRRMLARTPDLAMRTPYMVHHFVDALLSAELRDEAMEAMRAYWGGMAGRCKADTFFEAYNPADDFESPYNDAVLNSACHAWSCTPALLLRK